jgi:cobaltochelatase CobN
VRPHEREAVAPRIPVNPNLIAFLTHAGTGLMTLNRARPDLPAGLAVLGLSLLSISSEEQMIATLNGELAEAAVVMLRIHGRVEAVPAFELLKERCREPGRGFYSSAELENSTRRWPSQATSRSILCKR